MINFKHEVTNCHKKCTNSLSTKAQLQTGFSRMAAVRLGLPETLNRSSPRPQFVFALTLALLSNGVVRLDRVRVLLNCPCVAAKVQAQCAVMTDDPGVAGACGRVVGKGLFFFLASCVFTTVEVRT